MVHGEKANLQSTVVKPSSQQQPQQQQYDVPKSLHRPKSASNLTQRPQSAANGRSAATNGLGGLQRPGTAGSSVSKSCMWHTTSAGIASHPSHNRARLKAQLQHLAAASNIQLSSLAEPGFKAARPEVLQIPVNEVELDDLSPADGKLTYMQARSTAGQHRHQPQQQSPSQAVQAATSPSRGSPRKSASVLSTNSPRRSISWGSSAAATATAAAAADCSTGKLVGVDQDAWADGAAVAAAAASPSSWNVGPTSTTAAAEAVISQVKGWMEEQELKALQSQPPPSPFMSMKTAARLAALRSETEAMRYQRAFYDSELAKLQELPGFKQLYELKRQQALEAEAARKQQHLQMEALGDQVPAEQQTRQRRVVMMAEAPSPRKTFSHWDRPQTCRGRTPGARPGSVKPIWEVDPEYADAEDNWLDQDDMDELDAEALVEQELEAQAAPEMSASGLIVKPARTAALRSASGAGYFSTPAMRISNGSFRRRAAQSAGSLQLSHCGLRHQQLFKVVEALEASSNITSINLASNLLTDASIQDLVDILLEQPNALDVALLDLSHNPLLTWRTCQHLAPLLITAPPPEDNSGGEGEGGEEEADTWGQPSKAGGGLMSALTVNQNTLEVLASAASGLRGLQHQMSSHCRRGGKGNHYGGPSQSMPDLPPLAVLSLSGVQIGDRGAAALCEALPYNNTLQELRLSKCQLKGSGVVTLACGLICSSSLQLVDLSWNSVSHAAASALAVALRCNTSLLQLDLSHTGLEDRDGSLLLQSLAHNKSWRLVNLSHNALEGGSMMVACELLRAAAAEAEADADAVGRGPGGPRIGMGMFPGGTNSPHMRQARSRRSSAKLLEGAFGKKKKASSLPGWMVSSEELPADGSKWLKLDHNPLGASSMKQLLLTVAHCKLGHQIADSDPNSSSSSSQAFNGWGDDPALVGDLKVTVQGCSLIQRSKGLRANLSDTAAAAPIRPQVPYLSDAVQQPGDDKPLPPGISKGAKPSKTAQSAAALAAAAAVPAGSCLVYTEKGVGWDPTAPAGRYSINLQHPAAPALFAQLLSTKARLAELQALQQQKQAELRAAQQKQQAGSQSMRQQASKPPQRVVEQPESSNSSPSGSKRVSENGSSPASEAGGDEHSEQQQQQQQQRPALQRFNRSAADASGSRRVGQHFGAPSDGQQGQPAPVWQAAYDAAHHRWRFPIDSMTLVDINLDNAKPIKMEQLITQAPWQQQPERLAAVAKAATAAAAEAVNRSTYDALSCVLLSLRQPGAATGVFSGERPLQQVGGPAATAEGKAAGAGGASGKGQAAGGSKAASKGPRMVKNVQFVVKVAAVVLAAEPPILPDKLMGWVTQVVSTPNTTELWKLQLLEVLLDNWLLLPYQAVALLSMFDQELGQDERLAAAALCYGKLVQPLELWEEVLPPTLKPLQQKQLRDRVGPRLLAVDRSNFTGQWDLNLSLPLHRTLALRLQLAALQESTWQVNKYYLNWRNATYNGVPLREEAMMKLQNYAMPDSGMLSLDYVSYQEPPPAVTPASDYDGVRLLRDLRAVLATYQRVLLDLRHEWLPGGRKHSEEAALAAAHRTRIHLHRASVKGAVGALRLAKAAAGPGGSQSGSVSNFGTESGANTDGDSPRQTFRSQASTVQFDSSSSPRLQGEAGSTGPTSAASTRPVSAAAGGATFWWQGGKFDATSFLARSGMGLSGEDANARKPRLASAARAVMAANALKDNTAGSSTNVTGGATTPAAEAAAPTRPVRSSSSKAGRASSALVKSASSSKGASTAAAGAAGGSKSSGERVDQLLAKLLSMATPQAACVQLSRFGDRAAVDVLQRLAGMPGGGTVVAQLMGHLSPLVAVRFLSELPDASAALLPPEVRFSTWRLLTPAVASSICAVASAIRSAAATRNTQVQVLLRQFAAAHRCSAGLLAAVLRLLRNHSTERCEAVVALWTRIMDRANIIDVFVQLSHNEQRILMQRLGAAHVWSVLGRPDGLHFRLDLTIPEQRDVAREVVKYAVRKSLVEKAKNSGRLRHLENLQAEGKPVQDPEDDKLWLALESKHHLLEFDFARTWEQELAHMGSAVKRIQRAWRGRRLGRALSATAPSCGASTSNSSPDRSQLSSAGFERAPIAAAGAAAGSAGGEVGGPGGGAVSSTEDTAARGGQAAVWPASRPLSSKRSVAWAAAAEVADNLEL